MAELASVPRDQRSAPAVPGYLTTMTKTEAAMVMRGELARLEGIAQRVLDGRRRTAAKRAPSRQVKADKRASRQEPTP